MRRLGRVLPCALGGETPLSGSSSDRRQQNLISVGVFAPVVNNLLSKRAYAPRNCPVEAVETALQTIPTIAGMLVGAAILAGCSEDPLAACGRRGLPSALGLT